MRRADERGVALVELAFVLPLLILLSFGVVEAAWAFSQQQAVRSMAREGARVATHHDGGISAIRNEICESSDLVNPVRLEAIGVDPSTFAHGDRAYFEAQMNYTSLTGLIPAFNGVTIVERVEFNVEQVDRPSWWGPDDGRAPCPP